LHLGAHADIRPPHFFVAGDYVAIGKNFICEVDCELGREILISSNVAFVGNQHRFDSPDSSVYWQGRVENDVVKIGNDCLIGFGTIVVGNVTVGDGCIVGAGSVVTRDLPPGFVCVGAPARPIRRRFGS
jgi:acetyltransferase-like isoleucine patch superfamily enzyme